MTDRGAVVTVITDGSEITLRQVDRNTTIVERIDVIQSRTRSIEATETATGASEMNVAFTMRHSTTAAVAEEETSTGARGTQTSGVTTRTRPGRPPEQPPSMVTVIGIAIGNEIVITTENDTTENT